MCSCPVGIPTHSSIDRIDWCTACILAINLYSLSAQKASVGVIYLYLCTCHFLIALITCRLDYCNSLLYNIASRCVQNCLARFVTQSHPFSYSVPLPKSLHWLLVQSCIAFKPCTIAYQTLSSGEPLYLFSMLSLLPKPRELHSSGFHLLSVLRVKTCAGTHAFSVAVPVRLNSLPEHVKSSNSMVSFCHHLKTHLFRLAYPS